MYAPARDDEKTGLIAYIEQQLDDLRAAALGLTEEQARATPCRSELSVAGLLKHVVWVMRTRAERVRTGARLEPIDEAGVADFLAGFALRADETCAETLAEFDRVRADYLAALRTVDPDADDTQPSSPWDGIDDARPIKARYWLVHEIEEFARHAGHADIIREQLDGESVPRLGKTRSGLPANAFFTPYQPPPETLGA